MRAPLRVVLALSTCILFFSCKKEEAKEPQTISVDAAGVEIGVYSDGKKEGMVARFLLNGITYRVFVHPVVSGNGTVRFLNSNFASNTSEFTTENMPQFPGGIPMGFFFNNPTIPNSITFSIDKFSESVQDQDKSFNKIILNISQTTVCAITAKSGAFYNDYKDDRDEIRDVLKNVIDDFNDDNSSVFDIWVQK